MRHLLLSIAVLMTATMAEATPAVVYSVGGKFDASFNEAAWRGAERWAATTGERYGEYEIERPAESEQALRFFASRGYSPVVAIGFLHADALRKVAEDYPDTRFTIVDIEVDAPNVQSVVFREHEGSFITGKMAAMTSESGVIGFVGGMDIPLIRRFECGYRQGAASVSEETRVLATMTGDTPAAWADPVAGAEIARGQIAEGADIIMQAAGGTGIGVLQAAADAGILGIGTDSNQNALHPGHVLTSLMKRVDVAVEEAFDQEKWAAGVLSLGIAEGGLSIAMDENNAALVTEEVKTAADEAARSIAAGETVVHDTYADGDCPF
ncbi:BMP family lipoprotein [Pontivivens ytuae]|uniref:BMP family ABC transporter substrate-binding protein n=1 Tax=Pontivivens ytuae TaxID=2789856 RepID=A0A7S9LTR8_9RHOB|nr:BMP family ABC transporter substrate-binding protein [Pontivivens ytuae]QPH55124.1 BMP family ABC transporter substrate-binding protein [Pontivivens ytuae]